MLNNVHFSLAIRDWWIYAKAIRLEDVLALLDKYSQLGPLPGIALPFVEAFLPVLPLILFVFANAAAYGMWAGFFYSWVGVSLGALCVFWISKKIGTRYGDRLRKRFPKAAKFLAWIERKGFTPIFLLSCFPFTPSSVIVVAAGLSRMPLHTFLFSVLPGKAVMIFVLSFIGHDLRAMAKHPSLIALAALLLVLLWLGGRKLESRYS